LLLSVVEALVVGRALMQLGLLGLTQFYLLHPLAHLQATSLLLAVGMGALLIMVVAHKVVLVVLAAAVDGMAALMAVVELLDKETLVAKAVHLMAVVGAVQALLVSPTLMVAQVLRHQSLEP